MAAPNTNPTYQYVGGEFGDGTVMGQTSASLQAFWGATPSAQVAFTNAAVATTAATTSLSTSLSSAQYAAIIALVNEVRAAMVSMGLKA
jgi:hypothetical protein